jgi:hypothetical protein
MNAWDLTSAHEVIVEALLKLERYILQERYRGYDPYDALTSPIFRLPVLNRNKFLRLGVQQVLKRLPINIRPLLGIPKGYNPVTLGLCLQAYTYLLSVFPEKKEWYLKEIKFCVDELENLQSKGYSGACWGYDFDWDARYARIPAFTPTVVATGFITHALFTLYRQTQEDRYINFCHGACDFILHDLHRTYEDGSFCFSYSPLDRQCVYNATLKGARLLAQVYSVTHESDLKEAAAQTVQYVIKNQKPDGSWSYSKGDTRTWVDNFHTAYVLDSLEEFIACTGLLEYKGALQKGYRYYRETFFTYEGIPRYYSNQTYPIDSTAVAQSILTLIRFGDGNLARQVALWAIQHMQAKEGYFYYQTKKRWINRIPYMRWSNAWMLSGLSALIRFEAKK